MLVSLNRSNIFPHLAILLSNPSLFFWQVWYPSHGENPFKQEDFLQLDPELEFDREVYPLGLLPNVGVVVGISQRMSFSTAEFPCFEPSPQAQTILHCLLRHLLQVNQNIILFI
jgi:hypothetical protein